MSEAINARMEIGFFDARASRDNVPAQVTFEQDGMTLVLNDIAGTFTYRGDRKGQGHYLLNALEAGADATLHRFSDSLILEGFWRMNGDRGFWRLHLPAYTMIPAAGAAGARKKAAAKPAKKAAKKTATRAKARTASRAGAKKRPVAKPRGRVAAKKKPGG